MTHDSGRSASAVSAAIRRLLACAAPVALAATSAALAPLPALAQQAPDRAPQADAAQAPDEGLQEVVVSARFRTENLQQTPIAITALSTEQLEQRSFTNVNDLGLAVPNAYFRPPVSNYGPTETIGLRGITQVDYSYSFEPAVALYIDDVYHGTMTGSSMDLADLARVEVLNGPQGTLFGKNSLGGAIRLISTKPKGSDTASVEVTYGEKHRLDVKAIADLALIPDVLYTRVIGVSRSMDGVGKYLDFACAMAARGTPQESGSLPLTVNPVEGNDCGLGSLGGYNHQAARLELRLLATSDLEINIDADYSKQADDPPLQTLLTTYGGPSDTFNNIYDHGGKVFPGAPALPGVVFPTYGIHYTNNPLFLSPSPWDNYSTYGDVVTGQHYDPTQYLRAGGESLTADYRITDELNAKLVLAHRSYQSNWINDSDLTPFGLTQTYNQQEHSQYQAEFRLSGNVLHNTLDWTAGVFYYDSHDRVYYPTNFDAYAYTGLLPNFVADDHYSDRNESGFLHATYKLTDKWSLAAGVRYTDEHKSNLFQHYGQIVIPYPKGLAASRFDYNGSIDFQATQNVLVYGSVATGFRSPGFNPRISTPGQLVEVPGEEAIQYEIGNKTEVLDHRLRVNTAIFYIDYQKHLNLQLGRQCNLGSDPDAGQPYFGITSCPAGTPLAGTPGISPWFVYTAAPASIRGAELQLAAEPIDGLSLNYTFGFNQFRSKTSDPKAPGYVDPSVKLQPEINMSSGAQYAIALPGGATLTPRLDWFYQSYQTNGPQAQPQIHPDWIVPGYSLFNARLTFMPSSGKWTLAAGLTNVFNKFYWEQLGAATTGTPPALSPAVARVGTPGMPREWTVTLRKDF